VTHKRTATQHRCLTLQAVNDTGTWAEEDMLTGNWERVDETDRGIREQKETLTAERDTRTKEDRWWMRQISGRKRNCWTMNDTDPSVSERITCPPRPDPDLISPIGDSFFLTRSFRNDSSTVEIASFMKPTGSLPRSQNQTVGHIPSQMNPLPYPISLWPSFHPGISYLLHGAGSFLSS